MKKLVQFGVYIFAAIGFVLVSVYAATQLGLTNSRGIVDNQHDYFKNQAGNGQSATVFDWLNTEEWPILKAAIAKDVAVIQKAAQKTGVPARMIVAPLVVEQLRLFHDNREIFKQIFAPLKILGNQSQFSWGVMGIKQDTAKQIEANLVDSSSPFYVGPECAHLLDYSTSSDSDGERFNRLTNEKDRYYSYLYAGLLIRELEAQWRKAGFPIEEKPAIVATLFNIGFAHSNPGPHPEVGGAEITIGSTTYSFGGLAGNFYDSDELIGSFPR